MSDNALVSCLCVTNNRVSLLRRAVDCYLNQTYRSRELIIAYNADDHATSRYLETVSETSIRAFKLPATSEVSLGSMRNLAVEAAHGHYVAIWDDDDWHGPTRVAAQVNAIQESGKPNCVLSCVILYDSLQQKAYYSERRCWEGTLVGLRSKLPSYKQVNRAEDTPVITKLYKDEQLVFVEAPDAYIYVYHGGNTVDQEHWEDKLVRYGRALPDELTKKLSLLL